jgi:hypothetical protein
MAPRRKHKRRRKTPELRLDIEEVYHSLDHEVSIIDSRIDRPSQTRADTTDIRYHRMVDPPDAHPGVIGPTDAITWGSCLRQAMEFSLEAATSSQADPPPLMAFANVTS